MKQEDIQKEQDLLRQITAASNAIRQKYLMIKTGCASSDRVYADILKPVVTPLKELVEEKRKKKELHPIIKKEEPMEEEEPMQEEQDVLIKARRALRQKDLDKTWGVPELKGQWMIGDSLIQTKGNQLIVHDHAYTLTPGLLELILKKHPNDSLITTQDWNNYKTIVTKTHADRLRYHKNARPRSTQLEKIKKITKKGTGMLPRNMLIQRVGKMDYIYWDDPNELVDRLQLLSASYQAGNKSHTNEIMSILEELREANLIE